MNLSTFRHEIDSVDTQLVQLFCRRMELSADIAVYKKENGLQIYDPIREASKLTAITEIAGEKFAPYAEELFKLLFALSKDYQHKCNNI